MKLMIGFATGFLAGAVVTTKLDEQRRNELERKVDDLWKRGRTGEVRQSVTGGAADVADAVTDRVDREVDRAAGAVADRVEQAGTDDLPVPEAATT